jgi:hypothetical protein
MKSEPSDGSWNRQMGALNRTGPALPLAKARVELKIEALESEVKPDDGT